MKGIIIALIIGIVIGGIVAFVYVDGKSGVGGFAGNIHPLSASISSTDEVGPDENVRVVASSTNRAYLSIQSDGNGNVPVYCEANGDNLAVSGEGIKLATSSNDMLYEFTSDKGNLFGGSLRCTATASTTLLIQQYLIR